MRLRKNGTLGSLFINRKAVYPLNEWMNAEDHPTDGYAQRMGWHCLLKPIAPHLGMRNRVWVEVEIEDFKLFERPLNQGGKWALANRMKINKILP